MRPASRSTSEKEKSMKAIWVTSISLMLMTGFSGQGFAFDPGIENIISKAYNCAVTGDVQCIVQCSHPEISKFKGTFDTGYSAGRSGSLAELWSFAMGVTDKSEKVTITDMKIEIVKVEGEKAIAWAKYHIVEESESQLESTKGQWTKEAWDAQDYIILKKYNSEWRLRRLEERAEHFSAFEKPTLDEWGGVE